MAIEKKFIREQVNRLLIAEYLQKETDRAGFGGLEIQRTPMGTRVSIVAERPGMIIGRKGSTINALTENLAKNFGAENPQIEVVEAGRNANLNAHIMARKVSEALERGWHFRRAGHSTVQRIMESGARGCIVILNGKLTGQRHRTEKFIAGHIKYCGEPAERTMMVGYAQCKKKLGTIGCTVKIMYPDARLPDEVTIFEPGQKQLLTQAPPRPAEPATAPETAAPASPAPEGARRERRPEGRRERPARREAPAPSVGDAPPPVTAAGPTGSVAEAPGRPELPSERHKRLEAEAKAKRKTHGKKRKEGEDESAEAPAEKSAEEAPAEKSAEEAPAEKSRDEGAASSGESPPAKGGET